jgi:rRNA-processing protein FCF1
MKNILLDTSFILTALKYKIDIESELRKIMDEKFTVYYIDKTIKELEGKPLEKLAKDILKKINAKKIITKEDKNVDSLLITHSTANKNILVATQDKRLKEKLKKRNVGLITIRQRKYLKITH